MVEIEPRKLGLHSEAKKRVRWKRLSDKSPWPAWPSDRR